MSERRDLPGKGFQDARYRAAIEALSARRRQMGPSQAGAGKLLGRHQQFVSRYETGERRLDVFEFIDIAMALGSDPLAIIKTVMDSPH
jgi:transcriptional regulator with XRE-family HTH domain